MKALRAAAAFLLAAGAFCPVAAHAAAHMLERASATHEHEDGVVHRHDHDASEPHPVLESWTHDEAPRLAPGTARLITPRRAVIALAEPAAPLARADDGPGLSRALDPPLRPPSSVVPPACAGRAPPR